LLFFRVSNAAPGDEVLIKNFDDSKLAD